MLGVLMKKAILRKLPVILRASMLISYFLLLVISHISANGSIIILYGCSSAGKTSISKELGKTLEGKWKVLGIDMFSNKEGTANSSLWRQANKDLRAGYNLVVDTVFPNFLIDHSKNYEVFTVLTYCSPDVLVEHVKKRNSSGKDHDHRTLKKVLTQYCNKYRSGASKELAIDVIRRSDIESIPDWRARRKIKDEFFKDNRHVVYIASKLYEYNSFINTGKNSISGCAKKIREAYAKFQKDQAEALI